MQLESLTLKHALGIHYGCAHESVLPNVLGDGYLYKNSSFYKKLRDYLLKQGVKFETENQLTLNRYSTYPLMLLNEILETRTIPCANTVEPLHFLDQKNNMEIPWMNGAPVSPITHESTHIVVNDFYGGGAPNFNNAENKISYTCEILAGEAAANSLEHMISNEQNNRTYTLFSKLHLYHHPSLEVFCRLKFLNEQFPRELVFKFIFYSYVYSNFYHSATQPREGLVDELLSFLKIKANPYQKKLFERGMKDAFSLNRYFTFNTTAIYFKMINAADSIEEIYNFDIDEMIKNKLQFEPIVNHFIEVLGIHSEVHQKKPSTGVSLDS